MYLSKRSPPAPPTKDGAVVCGTPEEHNRYAALFEFLACDLWPDGAARQPGTALFFVEDGRLKMCLSDRAQGLVAFVTGTGLVDLLLQAEEGLRSGELDWRNSRPKRR